MESNEEVVPQQSSSVVKDPTVYFNISIADDLMSAYFLLDTTGLDLNNIASYQVHEFISKTALDKELLDLSSINTILAEINRIKSDKNSDPFIKVQIATGRPVVPGEDGWVKFFFPHNQRVVIKDDGKADFRNIEKYVTIKKDQKIATMFFGVPGVPGKDIKGNSLNPSSISKPKVAVGKNVILNEYNQGENLEKKYIDFIAACDGALFSNDSNITVYQELTVETDVGLTTGNIKYDGTVNVHGSVEEGSKIECTGNLLISEIIETSDIFVGRDLIVKGGIKAKGKDIIRIGGDLRSKFIENSSVEVTGDIIIESFILNSKIQCLGSIVLTGQNSSIISSEIIVHGGLSIVNLGSNAGMPVTVELGMHFKNGEMFNELQNKIKISEKELVALTPKFEQVKNLITKARGKIEPEKKAKYKEIIDLYQKKNQLHQLLLAKYEELKTGRFNMDKVNLVVRGIAHPGTVIKYRRQVEKVSIAQSAFMMNFFPGQDSAPMTAISTKKPK